MLGKQWLNRYASTDMRGNAIERSQNRQRKLDGITTWYFDYVMESLPLMLQAALMLLGCALSLYLWEIDVTVASVVVGVTSFGIIFYILVVVAGTASESCPYQTPGARIFRHISHRIPHYTRSIFHYTRSIFAGFFSLMQDSFSYRLFDKWKSSLRRPWYSVSNITNTLYYSLRIPITVVFDIRNIGRAVAQWLVAVGKMVYHRIINTLFPKTHSLDQESLVLDLQCILWMLQTSLDKAVHLPTFKHLGTMTTLPDFDPALIADCFRAFVGCVEVGANKRDVAVVRGSEQLAAASALSFFNITSHLLPMDPPSSALEDVRQRYLRVFSSEVNFRGHQFYHIMTTVHYLFVSSMPWER